MRTFDYGVTSPINQYLKNNSVATDVSIEALIEWNYNNCFKARGVNLVNAGDDVYSFGNDERLYSVDQFGRVSYPKTVSGKNLRNKLLKSAESVAKSWVEPFDQTVPIMTSNPNHNKLYNYPSKRIIPFSENGYGLWYSQKSQSSNNFFASKATELKRTFAPSYITTNQGPVDIYGFVTQTPGETNGVVRLLVGSRQSQSDVGKILATNGNIRGSQWDSSDTLFIPAGRHSIVGVGEGYLPDVIWGTTRGGQNVIKFNQYRDNTFKLGARLKPQSSGQPANWWNSDTGFAKVTGVSRNFDNAPNGRFWVDVNFSPEVGDQILFRAQEGVIYTYFYWIDISLDNVPNLVAQPTLGIKQITGVPTVKANIVNPVTNEQELRTQLAASAIDGSTVHIDDDITLNSPIVLPSNLYLFAGSHTISASSSFSEVYEYLVYSSAPEMFFGLGSSSGGTSVISVSSTTGLNVGQLLKIEYDADVSSPASWGEPVKEKVVIAGNIVALTSNSITIDQIIDDEFSGARIYQYPAASYRRSGNINIIGGTWNTDAAQHDLGVIKISNTEKLTLSGLTMNSVGTAVSIEGSSSISVNSCAIASDSTGIRIESGVYNSSFKNCSSILIDGSTVNSEIGIESVQQLGLSVPNHSIIKISNNLFTSSSYGINLQNCTDVAIHKNSFNGAGVAVSLLSVNTKSHSAIISNNSFGNSDNEIMLGGLNSESGYTGAVIKNNTGIDRPPVLINAAFVAWINNKNGSGQVIAKPSGTFSDEDFPIMSATPSTVYEHDSVEVIKYKKVGGRIELYLSSNLSSVKPGGYLIVENVHPHIDGARKVLGYSYSDDNFKLTLSSNLYGDVKEQSVDSNDNVGFVVNPKYLPINSVTVKFDDSFGLPSAGTVQLLTNQGWSNIYSFSDSDLSNTQEDGVSRPTNIKSLRIFFDGVSWSKNQPNSLLIDNVITAGAVRVVIFSATQNQSLVCVPHVSGRLIHDVTEDIISASIQKELGDAKDYMPVGTSSSNTGSLTLTNDKLLYSQTNSSSPLYGLFVQDALTHVYLNYPDSKIKIATMVVSGWDSTLREESTIELTDKSIVLQNASVLDTFLYQKDLINENLGGVSLTTAIRSMLDSIGFGNVVFFGSSDSIKAFYTRAPDTPWSVLQQLLEPYQAAAYFDEYGVLQIMYNDYIFPETYFVDGSVFTDGGEYKVELPVGNDIPVSVGMSVVDSSDYLNFSSVKSVSGNIITLQDSMTVGRYTLRLSQLRDGNNYVVGRNSELESQIDYSEIHTVGPSNYYNFTIEKTQNISGISNSNSISGSVNKFTKSNEFYVTSAKRVGGTVTATLNWASAMVKPPVNGDSMFFDMKNMTLNSDDATVSSVSLIQNTNTGKYESATLSYSVSGSQNIPSSNRIAGEAGYRSGKIYYKLTNIFPGQEYEFSCLVAKSSASSVSIYADTNISEVYILDDTDIWTPVSISFVADTNSPEIVFDVSDIDSQESLYVYQESIVAVGSGGNVWKDEIMSVSQEILDSASTVEVSFSTVNPYSEKSTNLEGQRQIGQNTELWRLEDYILPVFELLELDVENSRFRFNQSGMNEGAISQPTSSNDKIYAWIPYSGFFSTESNPEFVYEYEGLEAEIYAPYESTGQPSEIYVVKNDSDYVDARNKNLGLPLRWTGVGLLKKNYPELEPGTGSLLVSDVINVDAVYDNSNFKNVTVPVSKSFNKLYLTSGYTRRAIYFRPNISNINTVGATLSSNFASDNSEIGLIFNGEEKTSSGMFVGIRFVSGEINPVLRLKNEFGEVESVSQTESVDKEEFKIFASQLDQDIIARNYLYLPSIYKIGVQIQEEAETSKILLFFNSTPVATFEVETSLLSVIGGVSPGVYIKNGSAFVSSVYWASQSEPFVDSSFSMNSPSSADLYARFAKDNPFISKEELLKMISTYNDVVNRGASEFGELAEFRKRGIPHESFGFYGFQRNSDILVSEINVL